MGGDGGGVGVVVAVGRGGGIVGGWGVVGDGGGAVDAGGSGRSGLGELAEMCGFGGSHLGRVDQEPVGVDDRGRQRAAVCAWVGGVSAGECGDQGNLSYKLYYY